MNIPEFFPILNVITGPPGILRNGGIWKWIKKDFIENDIQQFMTQVLHFTDFHVSKKTLELWFSNGKTLKDWFKQEKKSYNPKIFTDSGGFKFLFNKEYNLRDFGIKPTQEDIFSLQLKYGADLVASLDYPIPPNLNEKETRERMTKSIENAIRLLELVYDEQNSKKVMPYLCVHGRNGEEVSYYLEHLFNNLEEYGFFDKQFGLALGSLVLMKNHYSLLGEIVYTTKKILEKYEKNAKIHIFGISGYVIPFLIYLGVSSFDSNTYVLSAQNLEYILSNFHRKNFYKIQNKDLMSCGCKYCEYLLEGDLSKAKKILKTREIKKHIFKNEEIVKSKIYATIALHNLEVHFRVIERLGSIKSKEEMVEWLIDYSKGRKRAENLLKLLAQKDEIIRNYLEDLGIKIKVVRESFRNSLSTRKEISLKITPEFFNVNRIKYYPPKDKKIMLILPCTSRKPYSESRTWKHILGYLKENNVPLSQIEIVALSGMFGPVPKDYENHPAVLSYEYVLTTSSKDRIKLIVERMIEFLNRHGEYFEKIIAYVTTKAYRKVIIEVKRKIKNRYNIILLPHHPRKHISKELYKEDNLKKLYHEIMETLAKIN